MIFNKDAGMIARLRYYLSSIPTILGQIRNWYVCFGLLLTKRPVIIRLKNGCQFKVRNVMDVWIIKETCLDRDYESHAIPIQEGWIVIDIGAGLGDFAVSVAYEHPGCHVYAYEPFPESFRLLEENIILNGTRNVTPFPVAVGATSEPMTLFTIGTAVQHSTTSASRHVHSITVKGLSLDDVLETNAIPVCDFLKMDCEGGEFDILFSASEATLRKIRHICLEYHDGVTKFSHADLVEYLQKRGFHVRTAPNPAHKHLGFLYAFRPSGDGL